MKRFEPDITNAINVLQQGGIILYPTDTIWGLGCDATDAAAIRKIFALKNREEKKSMIILLQNEDDLEKFVQNPPKKIIEFIRTSPVPTTAIFDHAKNLPKELVAQDGSIAIRIVRDVFCAALIAQFGRPIVSTSANTSGNYPPRNFVGIEAPIKYGVDYIVQHRQDELEILAPSAIIRLNLKGNIEKIR